MLNTFEVRYLLIGGYAVNLYGFVRTTGDMDFFIDLEASNIQKLVAAYHEFGVGSVEAALFQPGKIVRMGVPPMRLEVLNRISGVDFAEAYAERETVELEGLSVPVISLRHLRANKVASGRPKDLGDLSELPTEDPNP
ncbi:DUF6036 family nucleotidyltransferase [Deinococcus marmoris]|uniref:DUF6036 family nucleotidyltransferase n=1 Tax=Deinococcus marmoris TaxID=249408 RepID=UPI00158A571C|nr:DUF6036 family nucleotidyltransferase [Deinococcus marmoris]